MKKTVVLIALSLVFVFQAKSQYCMKISADSVRIKYALLNTDSTFGKTDEEILFDLLDLAFPNQFQPTDTFFSPDHTISYVKYIQLYSGYLVENSSVILAKRNDSIFRFSGYYVPVRNLTVNPKNSLENALIVYDTFYSITDSSTNYYYELVVTEDTTPTHSPTLCYKIESSAYQSFGKTLYINAITLSMVKETNMPGAGFNANLYTQYYGIRQANTWPVANVGYTLRDTVAATEIEMCNTGTCWDGTLYTYISNSTDWISGVSGTFPQYILDAYWAGSQFSYYLQDNYNCPKEFFQKYYDHHSLSYIVPDTMTTIFISSDGYVDNTHWNRIQFAPFRRKGPPQRYYKNIIIIGAPGSLYNPRASIDDVVHEFAHIFAYQSWFPMSGGEYDRPLDEACSDIWAAIITHKFYPENESRIWKIGDDIVLPTSGNSCVRNLANPSDYTAEMQINANNCVEGGDNIYEKSGVISHWFYLLTHGFTGTGCNGVCFSFTGIPVDSAAKLIYYCELAGFHNSITLDEICQCTLDMTEIFENSSEIKTAVLGAWNALNVYPYANGVEKYGLSYQEQNEGIYTIDGDLIVESQHTLVISGTLKMTEDARIIVRSGGKLIVDGGTLTNACTGEMWQGIFVEGNRNLHQTEANQGTVVLRNGAVIENALRGIRTGAPGDNWNTTGGIVQCSNSTFHNNRKSVEFLSYADVISGTNIRDNLGSFSNCTFTVDNDNLFASNSTAFDAHATLWDVKGVTFEGCTFANTTTAMTYDRGYAIWAIDAGFRVATLCDTVLVEPTTICQCPENKATYSQFSGFLTAISASTSGNTYYVLVDEAQFSNNGTGISVSGNNHVTVTRNDFDMNSLPGTLTEGTGLSLNGCTGYLVEENNFHRTSLSGPFPFEGICVTNSGTAANLLYRNDFSRLNKAVTVVGTNRGTKNPVGLECKCNTFYGIQYDIYVSANSSMSPQQGSSSAGADNQFSGTTVSSLYNAGSYAITYYNSGTGIGLVPYNPTANVTVWSNAAANPCQSTLCGSGNVLPPPGPTKSPDAGYLALKAQYDTLLSEFKSRGYADIVADPSEDIHSQAIILSARLALAQLGELERELHTRSNNAVRALLRDTLLDLPALESWFAATPGLSSRYSLAETEYLSGASNVLTLLGVSALLETEEERDEYDNYMAFNALKEALSGHLHGHADWPSATGTQIAELQRIADANTGRSSVMARGVLCFFFGICEDEDFTVMGDPRHFAATRENDISSHHQDVSMKLYPNPATNTLHVELEGLDDLQGTITVADITGVVVQYVETSQHGVTIDVSHLTPGLYVVSFRNKNGVAVRKFVKM